MPELKAQRKLVKSPPELWSELSDVQSLSRHLGEFGEIRITKLEPESSVEWEGEEATGTVELSPAGWGTEVTITASMPDGSAPAPEGGLDEKRAEDAALTDQPPVPDAKVEELRGRVAAAEGELEGANAALVLATEQLAAAQRAEPVAASSEPEPDPDPPPRGGFFARLFGWGEAAEAERRAAERLEAEETRQAEAERRVVEARERLEAERVAARERRDASERRLVEAKRSLDVEREALEQAEEARRAAEAERRRADEERRRAEEERRHARAAAERAAAGRRAAEGARAERRQAVLEDVLDHLGQAHHRPFSRG